MSTVAIPITGNVSVRTIPSMILAVGRVLKHIASPMPDPEDSASALTAAPRYADLVQQEEYIGLVCVHASNVGLVH